MTVLALEPNPAQTATIRHIVSDLVRAELTLVHSKDDALRALRADMPDLILLPALFSPADEAELLAYLRTLPESAHVETLITPFLCAPDDCTTVAPRGWGRWWARRESVPRARTYDPCVFVEQLTSSLLRARQRRQQHAERCRLQKKETADANAPNLVTVGGPSPATNADEPVPRLARQLQSDRRAHRRFPVRELQGLRAARIKSGPLVSLVDLSAGGALLDTEFPLRPGSEAVLEVVGDLRNSIAPFRVARCQVSALEGRASYRVACAFKRPLALLDLVLARPVAVTDAMVDPPDRFDITLKSILDDGSSQ